MSRVPLPDFWLVKIDESEYWTDSIRQRVKRVWSVYLLDASRHTHLCELAPSYWLEFVESYPEHLPETDESERDKLSETIAEEAAMCSDQDMYVHVSDFTDSSKNKQPLNRLPRKRKYHISRKGKRDEELAYQKDARKLGEQELDYEYSNLLDSIREYVRSNSLL